VVRRGGAVVIIHVARIARRWCSSIAVRMAFDTRSSDMSSVQWEGRIVMVEVGSTPIRFVMALRAIRWETGCSVVRRGRAVVIIHVARVTRRWCSSETICMALDARRGDMRSVQWEGRVIMVEGGRDPTRYAVA